MSAASSRALSIGLLASLAITFAAAAVGAIASSSSAAFYASLDRPAWAPPASVFGPVWTLLYLLMAVSAWLVWRTQGLRSASAALGAYALQLVANALWTWLFFAWKMGAAAFVDAVVLWALVAFTAFKFWQARRVAGVLMLPYLGWVTYAVFLTFSIWRRNPGLL
ncbi:tryptophan-rich sensory protein [Ramlibacter sp. AW1]|uniref:Tryptophan-rich sensory protein n=1 Tax=Ramlibacter aurantiacus TaxID=2801330 RepID=A0A936ZCF8_9BURK|nr:TspO/MBR family protein [Ramlibacter aurantiacus]MBL0419049.1 tryptophan-rich sensory protein [Ramlibacter aurantiacus]